MATTVVEAAHSLSIWIVCGDREVATFATERGCNVIWRPPEGLNRAVTDGVDVLGAEGFDRVVVSHADLPLATDLTWLAEPGADDRGGVVLVPDRRNDGSNVLALPTKSGFRFAYGPGSAHAHELEAERIGLTFRSVPDADLGWDVDVPEDLSVFGERLETIKETAR